jgi:predicted transcriptional regulator
MTIDLRKIVGEVLSIALIFSFISWYFAESPSKTQVVYQVNLNFHTVNRHLDLLLEKTLVEIFQGPPKRYKTTSKGEEALECLKKIEAIYS